MHWKYCGHHSFCDFCKTHWFFCKLTVSFPLVLSVQSGSNLDTENTEMRNQNILNYCIIVKPVMSMFFNASSVTSHKKGALVMFDLMMKSPYPLR